MLARHAARLALTLAVLAPLACATTADQRLRQERRDAARARVPANAPSGLFRTGRWAGSLIGEAPIQASSGWRGPGTTALAPSVPMLGQRVTRDFDIEVHAWRDSTRLAFVFEPSGMRTNGRSGRMLPRALQVAGDTLQFELPSVLGHRDVSCRLVLARAGTWDGPCYTAGGDRAAVLTLGVPRAAPATGDR